MSQKWNIENRDRLKDVQIVHFRERNEDGINRLVGTVAILPVNGPGFSYLGAVSLVHPNDMGSRKIGSAIAQGRALKMVCYLEGLSGLDDVPTYTYPVIAMNDKEAVSSFIKASKAAAEQGLLRDFLQEGIPMTLEDEQKMIENMVQNLLDQAGYPLIELASE